MGFRLQDSGFRVRGAPNPEPQPDPCCSCFVSESKNEVAYSIVVYTGR